MLTHSYYEEDARVRREAETLAQAGHSVDVFALRRPGDGAADVIDGVSLHRLPVQRHQGAGVGTYLAEYLAFLARAAVVVTAAHRRQRYGLVQVHTLPDFLAAAAAPLRAAAGVPILLDLHEAMPEFFAARFPHLASRPAHALLRAQERVAIALSRHVLTVNDALEDRLVGLGVPRGKITVVLNAPDLRRFDPAASPRRPFMADGTLRLVYAGALTPTYEIDLVVDAIARLTQLRPGLPVTFDVFGRGDSEDQLRACIASRELGDRVRLHGRIPLEAVAGAIAAADIGIAPTRRSPMTDVSLSTKLFEYSAMGKPAIASALPTVGRYFAPDTLPRYVPGSADDLARVILELVEDQVLRANRLRATAARVQELSWDVQAGRYLRVVEHLAGDQR